MATTIHTKKHFNRLNIPESIAIKGVAGLNAKSRQGVLSHFGCSRNVFGFSQSNLYSSPQTSGCEMRSSGFSPSISGLNAQFCGISPQDSGMSQRVSGFDRSISGSSQQTSGFSRQLSHISQRNRGYSPRNIVYSQNHTKQNHSNTSIQTNQFILTFKF